MSLTQILGVASIIPFMALVGDLSQLQQDTTIAYIYRASGLSSESQFILWLGLSVLIMLFFASIMSMYTTWRISIFANKVGVDSKDSKDGADQQDSGSSQNIFHLWHSGECHDYECL